MSTRGMAAFFLAMALTILAGLSTACSGYQEEVEIIKIELDQSAFTGNEQEIVWRIHFGPTEQGTHIPSPEARISFAKRLTMIYVKGSCLYANFYGVYDEEDNLIPYDNLAVEVPPGTESFEVKSWGAQNKWITVQIPADLQITTP